MACTKAATINYIIPSFSAWPPQLVRHASIAGDFTALMGGLDDLSFYQSRFPKWHADRLHAVSEAIRQCVQQHARRLATEMKIAKWFISALTAAATLSADLPRILQLITANKISSHVNVAADVLWPRHGQLKTRLAESHRFAVIGNFTAL